MKVDESGREFQAKREREFDFHQLLPSFASRRAVFEHRSKLANSILSLSSGSSGIIQRRI